MADFRIFLQQELIERCRRNPRYSLRSFASSIGVNHGILSMVLRNKRPLTLDLIRKISLALKLTEEKISEFTSQTKMEKAKRSLKSETVAKEKRIHQLTMDTFNLISDWYHDAILELSRVKGFKPQAKYISARLGITVSEAAAAVERLERVGLIKIQSDGSWQEVVGDTATTEDVDLTSLALRNLQKQVLGLSLSALENVPKRDRDHSCTTFGIHIKDLVKAKIQIREFRQQLMESLQTQNKNYDEVYQLAVSFYPVTKKIKKEIK